MFAIVYGFRYDEHFDDEPELVINKIGDELPLNFVAVKIVEATHSRERAIFCSLIPAREYDKPIHTRRDNPLFCDHEPNVYASAKAA